MNPRDIGNFDQALASVTNEWVPALWKFYSRCMREGFTPEQALFLTRAFMQDTFGGCRGGSTNG